MFGEGGGRGGEGEGQVSVTYVLACVFKQAQGCSPGVFKGRGDCPLFTRRRSLGTAVGRSHELIASSVCAVCSQFVFTRPVTSVRCTRAVSVCAVCQFVC